LQPSAHRAVHQKRFVGTLSRHRRRRRLARPRLRFYVFRRNRLLPRAACAKLHRQIDLRRQIPDLNLAPQMIEAEQIRLDNPLARRHAVEAKLAVVAGEREQNAVALRGPHRDTGKQLALRLHGSGLCRREPGRPRQRGQ